MSRPGLGQRPPPLLKTNAKMRRSGTRFPDSRAVEIPPPIPLPRRLARLPVLPLLTVAAGSFRTRGVYLSVPAVSWKWFLDLSLQGGLRLAHVGMEDSDWNK